MAEQKLCTVCGTVGNTKRDMKGSILTEFLLWCFFLLPGLIYSIWRHSTVAQVCRNCGSPAVIPLGSPVAQQVLANRGASSGQIQAPASHSGAYALGAAARRAPTGKIAVGIIAGCLLIIFISIAMNTRTPANTAAQTTPEPPRSRPLLPSHQRWRRERGVPEMSPKTGLPPLLKANRQLFLARQFRKSASEHGHFSWGRIMRMTRFGVSAARMGKAIRSKYIPIRPEALKCWSVPFSRPWLG